MPPQRDAERKATVTRQDLPEGNPGHAWISAWLVTETLVVCAALGVGAAWLGTSPSAPPWCAAGAWVLVVLQGLWFQRLYGVGHESAHHKLFPRRRRLNDVAGQLALLPIAVPVGVFRKIHRFHHGHNRRDHRTSALDTFVLTRDTPLRRAACRLIWALAVFGGGFFLHSLVSIVLFLFLPLRVARRVSPAFAGWTGRDRAQAVFTFAAAVAMHVGVGWSFGAAAWAFALGLPLVVFALVYSALLYIYHYDTGYGPQVRTHVRSLRAGPWVARWLLHLNEHEVHHGAPSVPWYRMPAVGQRWARERGGPQYAGTVAGGILRQLRGPILVVEGVVEAPR